MLSVISDSTKILFKENSSIENTVYKAVAEQGGIATRGQIYIGAPIGVVEIHMQLEIAAPDSKKTHTDIYVSCLAMS